jgi:putative transposase
MGYAHDNIATGSKTGTFGQEKIKKIVFEICEENKIPIIKVNPRFTSQKCVECDYRHKDNRNGDKFCCIKCGFTSNVHEMAAVNISNKGIDDYMTKGYSHF